MGKRRRRPNVRRDSLQDEFKEWMRKEDMRQDAPQ